MRQFDWLPRAAVLSTICSTICKVRAGKLFLIASHRGLRTLIREPRKLSEERVWRPEGYAKLAAHCAGAGAAAKRPARSLGPRPGSMRHAGEGCPAAMFLSAAALLRRF